jgi:hypothetical protein
MVISTFDASSAADASEHCFSLVGMVVQSNQCAFPCAPSVKMVDGIFTDSAHMRGAPNVKMNVAHFYQRRAWKHAFQPMSRSMHAIRKMGKVHLKTPTLHFHFTDGRHVHGAELAQSNHFVSNESRSTSDC